MNYIARLCLVFMVEDPSYVTAGRSGVSLVAPAHHHHDQGHGSVSPTSPLF